MDENKIKEALLSYYYDGIQSVLFVDGFPPTIRYNPEDRILNVTVGDFNWEGKYFQKNDVLEIEIKIALLKECVKSIVRKGLCYEQK